MISLDTICIKLLSNFQKIFEAMFFVINTLEKDLLLNIVYYLIINISKWLF